MNQLQHGSVERDLGLRSFDTSTVPPGQALSYWADAICANFSPTQNESKCRSGSFHGSFSVREFGAVSVARYTTSPMSYVRHHSLLRQLPNDDFFVCTIAGQGEGKLSQAGRDIVVKCGDVVLYDSGKPFTFEFDTPSALQIVKMPRRALVSRVNDAAQLAARVVPPGLPFGNMIRSVMEEMYRIDTASYQSEVAGLGSSFVDMLATSLKCALTPASMSVGHGNLLDHAKRVLRENIENPKFTMDDLAKQVAASPRTIARAFACEATTPIRWLWQERLNAAHSQLQSKSGSSIGQIAMRCGFSDFSHFSRAFKKAFGATPKSFV